MFISFDLRKFQQLYETIDEEICIAERIEGQLYEILRVVNQTDASQVDFIKRRIAFSQELQKNLRERKNLLIVIYEKFSGSKRITSEKMDDALRLLEKTE